MGDFKELLKRVWYFIWEEDSLASWIVNIILAFVLIKFIVYPGLGLLLGTNYPIVAVVSSSMEHNGMDFQSWWQTHGDFYSKFNITEGEFMDFSLVDGFNKGDIMVLSGAPPVGVKIGDVIVYKSGMPDPIIHRVIDIKNVDGVYYFQTKGDNNQGQIQTPWLDETDVLQSQILGKAAFRVPYLGWIKIWFVDLLTALHI